jgi:hypothetical protein
MGFTRSHLKKPVKTMTARELHEYISCFTPSGDKAVLATEVLRLRRRINVLRTELRKHSLLVPPQED